VLGRQTWRRGGLFGLLFAFAGALASADAPDPFRLILPENPSPVTALAASELRAFLDRVFPPEAGATRAIAPVTFYIGPDAPGAGFDPALFRPGEFEVAVRGRLVRLAGYDGKGSPLELRTEAGTLSAVYYFLNRWMGIEFFFPGDRGVSAPVRTSLDLEEGRFRPEPSFPVRGITTVCDEFSGEEGILFYRRMLCRAPEWLTAPRLYDFADWPARFAAGRPELLAEANGKRVYHPWLHSNPCFSSEEAARVVADDVTGWLESDPRLPGVDLFQDIPYRPCQCERCRGSEARKLGEGRNGSEEYFGFVAAVAEQILAKHPDRTLLTHTKEYRRPSSLRKVDPRVVVHLLADRDRIYEPARFEALLALLREWRANGNPVVLKSYERYPHFKNYPLINPRHTARYARAVRGLAMGFQQSDTARGTPYAFSALNNYVQANVLWDADADEEALIRRFCEFAFPGAESGMERFYAEMERLWASKKNYSYDAIADSYRAANLEAPLALLREARVRLKADPGLFSSLLAAMETLYAKAVEKGPYYEARRPKEIRPPRARGPVAIDGRMDAAEWGGAAEYELLPIKFDPAGDPPQPGRVRILRDDHALYLGIVAEESRVGDLTQTCTVNGQGEVYADDSIEIMVAPAAGLYPYHQLMINSLGVWRQLLRDAEGGAADSDALPFTAAARVYGVRYEVEVAIPLSGFPREAFERPWRFNVFRNRYCLPANYGHADLKCQQWSGISIMGDSFHMVETYNLLRW
jgi:hypothetical protein